ncbi:MAG: OmpH family outer membrane protein [Alphaproteobacteria bacterium]|nr:OmpH family outer membrane protein [Alphaproteobacteria bacterium]
MANKDTNIEKTQIKKYKTIGMIAGVVLVTAAVAIAGIFAIRHFTGKDTSVEKALTGISSEAVSGADLRIAVINANTVAAEAKAFKDLRSQKEKYESKLRDELTSQHKKLEKEKKELERSQSVLSPEALQRRALDLQSRAAKIQRDLTERAQSVEISYQKAFAKLMKDHFEPVINGLIEKKNLSLVIDGAAARTGKNVANLDITKDLISALDKKVSSVKMEKPKGF